MIWRSIVSFHSLKGRAQFETHLAQIALAKLSLEHDHGSSSDERDETVADISEHDGEQERERDDSEQTGVHFLVGCHTVGIHNSLEAFGELVRAMESWRGTGCPELMKDRGDIGT